MWAGFPRQDYLKPGRPKDDCVADTHSLIWYLEDNPRLGAAAREAFDACYRGEASPYLWLLAAGSDAR